MLEFAGISILAIIIAWVVNVVVGAFWYSPVGLGKQWSRLTGVDMMKTPKAEANRAIILVAIGGLIQAAVLALIINTLAPSSATEAITSAVVVWLGFTAVTTVGNTLYQRQSLGLWWINASFYLVVTLINTLVIYYIQ